VRDHRLQLRQQPDNGHEHEAPSYYALRGWASIFPMSHHSDRES